MHLAALESSYCRVAFGKEREGHSADLRGTAPIVLIGGEFDGVTGGVVDQGEGTGADWLGGDVTALGVVFFHDRHTLETAKARKQVRSRARDSDLDSEVIRRGNRFNGAQPPCIGEFLIDDAVERVEHIL